MHVCKCLHVWMCRDTSVGTCAAWWSEANVWNFPPFLFHCILWGRVSWGLEYYKNCGSRVRISWRTVTIFFFLLLCFQEAGKMRSIQETLGQSGSLPPHKMTKLLQRFPNKSHLSWKWRNIFNELSFLKATQRRIRDVCMHCHAFLKGKMRQNTQFCSSEWIVFWIRVLK